MTSHYSLSFKTLPVCIMEAVERWHNHGEVGHRVPELGDVRSHLSKDAQSGSRVVVSGCDVHVDGTFLRFMVLCLPRSCTRTNR